MPFSVSFTPRAGLSGTEARALVAHEGAVFCGCGQWENSGPAAGPQIIRQDVGGGPWVLEEIFEVLPVNRIAVACLEEIHFPTARKTTLVCGFFGGSAVGVRNGPGDWTLTRIGNGTGQIRSFTSHIDSVTKASMAFAGANQGIFAGHFDTTLPGHIQWATTPELDVSGFPAMDGGHPERVMSFAELNGTQYASVGQKIFRRNDGGKATWTKVWDNPMPGRSQSGIRGLTVVNGALWGGIEGTSGRVVSVDPQTGDSNTEFDISGPKNYYVIVAYNNFCVVTLPDSTQAVFAGLDGMQSGPAHYIALHKGVWRRFAIPAITPQPMVSCRSIIVSPFNPQRLLFSGYDCNSHPSRNTEWIVCNDVNDALAGV